MSMQSDLKEWEKLSAQTEELNESVNIALELINQIVADLDELDTLETKKIDRTKGGQAISDNFEFAGIARFVYDLNEHRYYYTEALRAQEEALQYFEDDFEYKHGTMPYNM